MIFNIYILGHDRAKLSGGHLEKFKPYSSGEALRQFF
jgi:hypothetical protein